MRSCARATPLQATLQLHQKHQRCVRCGWAMKRVPEVRCYSRLADLREARASSAMPVHSIVEAADCPAAEQLLLTIGRAGVLSCRAIAAGELETLLRLLGPPSERQRSDLKRATDIVLIENGAVIYWPRTGEQFHITTPPMPWRACKRRSHEHRYPQARAGLAPQLSRSSDTSSVRRARRSHRLGRAHRRS